MEKDKEPTDPPAEQEPIEEPPPYRPDPDLITELEREARAEVTKIRDSRPDQN